jgi:hypothetical protein
MLPIFVSIVQDLNLHDVKAPYLLAFSAQVDDRPLYVENALLAIELTNGGWQLFNVFRHPKETNLIPHWYVFSVTDVPVVGARYYGRKPTREEVETFLKDAWWSFRATEGFRLVRGEVYSEVWKNVLGYEPICCQDGPKVCRQPASSSSVNGTKLTAQGQPTKELWLTALSSD